MKTCLYLCAFNIFKSEKFFNSKSISLYPVITASHICSSRYSKWISIKTLVINVTERGISLSADLYLPFLVQVLSSSVKYTEDYMQNCTT